MNPGPQVLNGAERRSAGRILRVLVVDDDADSVQMLSALLQHEGHVVHGVSGGKEALAAVQIFRPDAMIVDISIPGMSGYAVAQAVRNSFTHIRRPLLIAMTGFWREHADKMIAEQVGFDHHLLKPCDPAELLRLLGTARASRPG